MALDIFTDILLITVPFVILWNVQIPRRKKVVIFGIFSATAFIIVTAIIRVTLVRGISSQMRSPSIEWLFLWSNVEVGIGEYYRI